MRRSALRRTADAGFTLIELLIVIVILGILAAIVVFSVKGLTDKGDKAACNAEVATVDTAEEAYYAGNGTSIPGGSYTSNVGTTAGGVTGLVSVGLLHSAPKYVASYDTSANKVVLNGSAPAGCTAQ
jgi:general secretion pathway protein G